MKQNNNSGFTLIELLVVISIIGFLASTSVYLMNSARAESRDAQRLIDLRNIEKALEMYYSDYGYYPKIYNAVIYPSIPPDQSYNNWKVLSILLKDYMSIPLDDPSKLVEKNLLNGYYWYYESNSGDNWRTYSIMINLESKKYNYLKTNDGGYYPSRYEVGPQASYCMTKNGSNWWASGGYVCSGNVN